MTWVLSGISYDTNVPVDLTRGNGDSLTLSILSVPGIPDIFKLIFPYDKEMGHLE